MTILEPSSAPGSTRAALGRARSLSALCLSSLLLLGCRRDRSKDGVIAPPPNLKQSVAPSPTSERGKDALWQRALDGDPADLARLADREGALGLLDGLQEGGAIAVAALAALPLADDAEAAYGRLGEIVRQIDAREAGPVVGTILAIAARPTRQVEPVDPAGMKSCADALVELARKKSLAAAVRAPAISALRQLAEHHAVDPAEIPGDLDPK